MSSKERSLANLKSFPKGVSGNPGGRPLGTPLVSTSLRKLLRTLPGQEYACKNKGDEIALALYRKALKGNVSAIELIFERTEGKSPQTLHLTAQALPTGDLVERIVSAFAEEGVDEIAARRVLLRLSDDVLESDGDSDE